MENMKSEDDNDEWSNSQTQTDEESEEELEHHLEKSNEVETGKKKETLSPSHSIETQRSSKQREKNLQEIERLIAELDLKTLLDHEQLGQVQEGERKKQQSNPLRPFQPTQQEAGPSQNQQLISGESKQFSQPLASSQTHLQGQQLYQHQHIGPSPPAHHQLHQQPGPSQSHYLGAWPVPATVPAGFQMWNQAPQQWMNQPQPTQAQVGIPPWYQNMVVQGSRPVRPPIAPHGPSCYYVSRPAFPPYANNNVRFPECGKPQSKPEVLSPLQNEKQSMQSKAFQEERKSVDVEEQSIVSEIYKILKRYLESKGNNEATNSQLEPQHLSDSAGKQLSPLREQNKKTDISPLDNEIVELNEMVIPNTTVNGEESMALLETINSKTLELTRWITSITKRLDDLESPSNKIATSQVKSISLESVSSRLEAVELITSESTNIFDGLEKKLHILNSDMLELIKFMRSLEERLDAFGKAEIESRKSLETLEARLYVLEMLVAVSSSKGSQETTIGCDEGTLRTNISHNHPYRRLSNKGLAIKPNVDENSARPTREESVPISDEESDYLIKEVLDSAGEEDATFAGEQMTVTAESDTESDAVLSSEQSNRTGGDTPVQCSGTNKESGSETIVFCDSVAHEETNGSKAQSGNQMCTSAKDHNNGTKSYKYSRNLLLFLSCQPLSKRRPENLPPKLCRALPAEHCKKPART